MVPCFFNINSFTKRCCGLAFCHHPVDVYAHRFRRIRPFFVCVLLSCSLDECFFPAVIVFLPADGRAGPDCEGEWSAHKH